jgi:hypothetical protein
VLDAATSIRRHAVEGKAGSSDQARRIGASTMIEKAKAGLETPTLGAAPLVRSLAPHLGLVQGASAEPQAVRAG